jgi:putative two-component system response regulator
MPSGLRSTPEGVCLLGSESFARTIHELVPERFTHDTAVVPDVDSALVAIDASPPGLVLVDLTLVGADAFRLVSQLEPGGPATLVVGEDRDLDTMRRALELGASGSLIAPFSRPQLVAALTTTSELHERVLDLEQRIEELERVTERQQRSLQSRTQELRDALKRSMASEQAALLAEEETVHCLARAIESRDIVTGAHVERMSAYSELIAQELGLHEEAHAIGLAARLHDVGKVAVPDFILLKQSPLTEEERLVMRWHCQTGHRILADADSDVLRLAAVIALSHHEWFDGTGYPDGLAGEAIPAAGRITAIADSFDALTSDRPYRPALPFQRAVEIMQEERGSHFDPVMLDLFLGSDELTRMYRERA